MGSSASTRAVVAARTKAEADVEPPLVTCDSGALPVASAGGDVGDVTSSAAPAEPAASEMPVTPPVCFYSDLILRVLSVRKYRMILLQFGGNNS